MPDLPVVQPTETTVKFEPCCANCKHSVPNPQTPQGEQVFCRRFPPTVFLTNINRNDKGVVISNESMALFPVLVAQMLCGEWATKETKN